MTSRAELVKALKVFTLEELLSKVLPDLRFLEWRRIKKTIIEQKLSMSKDRIVNRIGDQLWQVEGLDTIEIVEQLYILGLILHNSRYNWRAVQLMGGEQKYMSSHELQRGIKRQLLREGTRGEVTVRLKAEIHWIRIVEKKVIRGRGVVSQTPLYVAVITGQPYMFLHGSRLKEYVVMCVVRALGRVGIKDCKLKGRDIKSLLSLLRAKEAKASSTMGTLREPQYQPDTPSRSVEGIDFMQSKSRHNHCKEILTNDENEMPQLEEMVIQVEGVSWNVDHLVPEMEGKPFKLGVSFRSTSIAQLFTDMATLGAMHTPLPEYARRLPTLGRNIVQLRSQ